MTDSSSSACIACHTPVPAGARFCNQCGTPVPAGAAQAPTPGPATPALPTQARGAPPAADAPGPDPGSALVDGRYQVLSRLGGGGFGEVFRVRDTLLGREFALKTLHPHLALNPEVRQRFIREARVLMDLQHPNLVPTRHMGEWRGGIYLVMDLSPGRTLASVLQEKKKLPGRTAAVLGVQVLKALEYAHGKGVMHRDLKPSNLLVSESETGKIDVRLLDFGVAKVLDHGKLEGDWRSLATGGPVGTWPYMSPEQIGFAQAEREAPDAAPIDFRSDLYSLGVLLYETITGVVPFHSSQLLELIRRVQQDAPPAFAAAGAVEDLPGLEEVVMRALSKRPEERCASAGEMLAELEALIAGERTTIPQRAPVRVAPVPPTTMRPSPPPSPPPKPERRRSVAAPALLALAAAGLLGYFLLWKSPAGFRVDTVCEPKQAGAVDLFPRQETYADAAEVMLTAKPAAGWRFVRWSDGQTAAQRTFVVPKRDTSLTAEFRSARRTLTIDAAPAEGGAIDPPDTQEIEEGARRQITATPRSGWKFLGWSDGDPANPRTFTMPAGDVRLYARFTPIPAEHARHRVSAVASPSQGGSVRGAGEFAPGAEVALEAVAAEGWTFRDWSDGATTAKRDLKIESSVELTARFFPVVETAVEPPEAGEAVLSAPAGGADIGQEVRLVAAPKEGWKFSGWSDGDTQPARTVKIAGPVRFVARFERALCRLLVEAAPPEGGTVAPGPSSFEPGAEVRLAAQAEPGWRFMGWSDGVKEAERAIVVRENAKYVATFSPVSRIAVSAMPVDGGRVQPESGEHVDGERLQLAAVPASGWRFAGWKDGESAPQRIVEVKGPAAYEARFERVAAATSDHGTGATTTAAPAGLKFLRRANGTEEYLHEESGIVLVLVPASDSHAKAFLLGKTEVTNAQFRRFHADHASGQFKKESLDAEEQPVVNVSWNEATAFCERFKVRLPTEAEWQEAALRAGVWPAKQEMGNLADKALADLTQRGPRDGLRKVDDGQAVSALVGQFPPAGAVPAGSLAIQDLIGNVWEWCADVVGGQYRAVRGGSYCDSPGELDHLDYRNSHPPDWDDKSKDPRERGEKDGTQELRLRIGFRVALDFERR